MKSWINLSLQNTNRKLNMNGWKKCWCLWLGTNIDKLRYNSVATHMDITIHKYSGVVTQFVHGPLPF
jgi:hypothetical protein